MQPNFPDLDQQANGPVGLADADGIKKGLNGSAAFLAQFLVALQAMRGGDFSVRMAVDGTGIEGKIADIFNEIVTTNYRMAKESSASDRSSDVRAKSNIGWLSACRTARGERWKARSIL